MNKIRETLSDIPYSMHYRADQVQQFIDEEEVDASEDFRNLYAEAEVANNDLKDYGKELLASSKREYHHAPQPTLV